MREGPPGFRDYVVTRLDPMRRTAYLLCGDWHLADDIVSTALGRLLRHWRRVSAMEQPDAYVRRIIVRAVIDETRRPWRRERSTDELPESAGPGTDPVDRMDIVAALATLPARRRAVLVLRYFSDLSIEDTAAALGCSPGTVKSQAARGLDTLRLRLTDTYARPGGQS